MLSVTFSALVITIVRKLTAIVTAASLDYFGDSLQLVFAAIITVIGICVVAEGVRKLFGKKNSKQE